MTDGTIPSRPPSPEKFRVGFLGGTYLALAGLAMAAWIAFLVWITRLVIAEF